MPEITILYWRDIPAQVIVGKGRKSSKIHLGQRFEQAIDAAAMRSGSAGSDDYLNEWRKDNLPMREGEADLLVQEEVARLDAAYDGARLAALVRNHGRDA